MPDPELRFHGRAANANQERGSWQQRTVPEASATTGIRRNSQPRSQHAGLHAILAE